MILDGTRGTLRAEPVDRGHRPHPPAPGRSGARAQRRSARRRTSRRRRSTATASRWRPTSASWPTRSRGSRSAPRRRPAAIEFLFLDRTTAPTEDEQHAVYRDIVAGARARTPAGRADARRRRRQAAAVSAAAARGQPVSRRARHPRDARTVRSCSARSCAPSLRGLGDGSVAVMFPMIATLDECANGACHARRGAAACSASPRIEAGIMVEVPSAALLADQFATRGGLLLDRHQRSHPVHAGDGSRSSRGSRRRWTGCRPPVLRLIELTVAAARKHGRWTGVCGGIAGDPQAVPLLVGLGVDELSVSVPAIPAVKAQIRRLRLEECRALARGPPSTCADRGGRARAGAAERRRHDPRERRASRCCRRSASR